MKFSNIIATTALAALTLIAAARPASPELMRHVNPDGSVVEFRMFGDDKFSYITDASGESILEFNAEGRLVPMMRDGVALHAIESDINRLREGLTDFEVAPRKVSRMADLETSGNDKGRTTFPSIGEARSCVILLEFPDRPFVTAKPGEGETMDDAVRKLFDRFCNEEGFSDYGARGSARDYYVASSNGKFLPKFDIYGPVKLQHPASWYVTVAADDPIRNNLTSAQKNSLDTHKQPRWGFALQEAIEALDDTVDFSIYDYDKNGEIDNIFFFYSGWGSADRANDPAKPDEYAVWPHQSNYWAWTDPYTLGTIFHLPRLTPDGVEFTCYATSCELNSSYRIPDEQKPCLDGIGAFCHEFGHVLGLPDLYDTSNSRVKTPGSYSIMDQGSYNMLSTCPPLYSAYEQWLCKWLDYTDAENGNSYHLVPLTDADRNAMRMRIRRPGAANTYYPEYYVMESRGNSSWDESLPEHGMFIWRINFDNYIWQSNEVNSYGYSNPSGKPHVEMINSNLTGSPTSFMWPNDYDGRYFIAQESNVLTPECMRTALDVNLTNMAYDEETGHGYVEYNVFTPSDLVTVMHDNPKANHDTREIYLAWDKVPGVESFLLTVKRTDSTGRVYTVDGLDDTMVNDNYRTVRNLTKNQWSQTLTAKVRVFNGVPGKSYSNEISFVPADLEAGTPDSGVESVGVEIPAIYGGQGCVIAPEGAKVYNMAGVECGVDNLPAGIYIVVVPGATAKVTVR